MTALRRLGRRLRAGYNIRSVRGLRGLREGTVCKRSWSAGEQGGSLRCPGGYDLLQTLCERGAQAPGAEGTASDHLVSAEALCGAMAVDSQEYTIVDARPPGRHRAGRRSAHRPARVHAGSARPVSGRHTGYCRRRGGSGAPAYPTRSRAWARSIGRAVPCRRAGPSRPGRDHASEQCPCDSPSALTRAMAFPNVSLTNGVIIPSR